MNVWQEFMHRPIVNSMIVCLLGAIATMVLIRIIQWYDSE